MSVRFISSGNCNQLGAGTAGGCDAGAATSSDHRPLATSQRFLPAGSAPVAIVVAAVDARS